MTAAEETPLLPRHPRADGDPEGVRRLQQVMGTQFFIGHAPASSCRHFSCLPLDSRLRGNDGCGRNPTPTSSSPRRRGPRRGQGLQQVTGTPLFIGHTPASGCRRYSCLHLDSRLRGNDGCGRNPTPTSSSPRRRGSRRGQGLQQVTGTPLFHWLCPRCVLVAQSCFCGNGWAAATFAAKAAPTRYAAAHGDVAFSLVPPSAPSRPATPP